MSFRRRPRAAAVARDAERMLSRYGPDADRVVGEMAWREDAGLLKAPVDGHWHQVHLEVSRQIGRAFPSLSGDDTAVDAKLGRPVSGSTTWAPGWRAVPRR